MKKGQVDVAVQRESSTDSTQSAREVNSTPSRRKRTRHTETSETLANEGIESSAEKKASSSKVASKKNSKTRSKSTPEQVDSGDVDVDNLSQQKDILLEADLLKPKESPEVQTLGANPFPNELQFNVPETVANFNVPYDVQPSSDRFFCSDEEFLRDKFDSADVDDFDDDFDEDFIQLDDMEFNESLDEPYDESDDPFEYSDEEMDSDSTDDDFDKLDSDENLLDDADEDYSN